MNGETRANPGSDAAPTTLATPSLVDKTTITIKRTRVARWLEMVDAAIDNPDERVDVLVDLATSIEDAWRTPESAT